MSPKDINYDKYQAKHCARYYGWLPESIKFKNNYKNKDIKYFTLCAPQAIDIFMFEKEGVLKRDKDLSLQNVIICEIDEHKASDIYNVVKPPYMEAIFIGKLQELLLYEDDLEITIRGSYLSDPSQIYIRVKNLNYKRDTANVTISVKMNHIFRGDYVQAIKESYTIPCNWSFTKEIYEYWEFKIGGRKYSRGLFKLEVIT